MLITSVRADSRGVKGYFQRGKAAGGVPQGFVTNKVLREIAPSCMPHAFLSHSEEEKGAFIPPLPALSVTFPAQIFYRTNSLWREKS